MRIEEPPTCKVRLNVWIWLPRPFITLPQLSYADVPRCLNCAWRNPEETGFTFTTCERTLVMKVEDSSQCYITDWIETERPARLFAQEMPLKVDFQSHPRVALDWLQLIRRELCSIWPTSPLFTLRAPAVRWRQNGPKKQVPMYVNETLANQKAWCTAPLANDNEAVDLLNQHALSIT